MTTFTLILGLMAAPQDKPSYGEVHALFVRYCLACHDRKEAEADLILESYATLMKGSENGPVVVPGNPDKSLLQRVIERKEKPYMPPKKSGKKMKPEEIGLLRAWIKAGAPEGDAPPVRVAVPKIKPTVKPRRAVHALAYDPRLRLVAAGRPGDVELRSADHRGIVRKLSGHAGNVNDVAFSRDGRILAAAAGRPGEAGEMTLWSPEDGKKLRILRGHDDAVYSVALSPDGKLAATGSYDQMVFLWETATGRKIGELKGHNAAVFDLAFRPDGKVLASVSGDRSVKLWSVPEGKRLDTLTESTQALHAVAFTPDGKRVAAAGVDNRIRTWRVSAEAKEGTNRIERTQFAHEGTILALRFSRDGKSVVTASEDRTVKISDGATLAQRRVLERQPDWPAAVAFALDGKAVVVGRLDGSIAWYETATGKPLPLPKPEIVRHAPRGLRPGDSVKVRVTGKGLAGLTGTWSSHPKLKVDLLADAREKSNFAWVQVTAAKDLAPGTYTIKLKSKNGETSGVRLYLDTLAQASEKEPNDAPRQATPVTLPVSVWGGQDRAGDRDHFSFEAKKGRSIVLDLAAKRLGSKTEAVVALLGPGGRTVATNIDYEGHRDPVVVYTVPADGRYVARVTDLQMASTGDHFYRLSVGTLPVVTGCIPLSVPANRESVVRLIGENLPADAVVKVKAGAPGETTVPVDPWKYRNRRPLKVVVSDVPEILEAEPNDAPAKAGRLSAPGSVNGRIGSPGDVDLYGFDSKDGETWVLETRADRSGSPADTRIEVLDGSGKPVPRVMLRAVLDSYVTFRPVGATGNGVRLPNWEEMDLGQFLYMNGEVVRLFQAPRGPDSQWDFYMLDGKRRCYFDTSATAHPLDEPCYIVEPHPPGTKLPANGLPTFTLPYANDDDSEGKLGTDSRLLFTAPKAGRYLIRVTDSREAGGDRNVYRLLVRRAAPDFAVRLVGHNPKIPAGSGRNFTVRVDRKDGFDGPVRVDFEGLPPGFRVSTPIVVEAGQVEAKGTVFAAPDAPRPTKENSAKTRLTATAMIGGKPIVRKAKAFGALARGGRLKVRVELDPVDASTGNELVIPAGGQVQALLTIDRDGFDDRVTFDVENLPHGVIVMDVGLNGILIPEKQTKRRIFIQCAPWVKPQTRVCHARAREVGNPTSKPIVLRVVEARGSR